MKQEIAIKIIENLKKAYPDAKCSLNFETPFQMMIAVMLSAQCTDERVNLTTPALFEKYPTANQMSIAPIEDLENLIHSCGFYKNKAKNMKLASQKIINDFEKKDLLSNLDSLKDFDFPGIVSLISMLHSFGINIELKDLSIQELTLKLGELKK